MDTNKLSFEVTDIFASYSPYQLLYGREPMYEKFNRWGRNAIELGGLKVCLILNASKQWTYLT